MRRFFFNQADCINDLVELSAEESHHLVKVLRLGVNSEIELLDGTGRLLRGRVARLGKRVAVELGEVLDGGHTVSRPLWFAQGLLKGDKMEMVVQKATELGVDRFFVIQMERVQGRLVPAQQQKKLDRWQRIMLESCKQCRRTTLMQLEFAADLQSFLSGLLETGSMEKRLLFWEEEPNVRLGQLPELAKAAPLVLLLGPEGGISAAEVAAARAHGFQTVSMGTQILRAETAAISALAISQHIRGTI